MITKELIQGQPEGLKRILEGLKIKQELNLKQPTMENTSPMQSYKPQVLCKICNDTLWITGENGAKRCGCYNTIISMQHFKSSGLNLEDVNKTFKNFSTNTQIQKDIKATATNYFLRFDNIKTTRNNSLLLAGQAGAGKTHLTIALANNFLKKGYKLVYMSYRETITALKQNMLDKEYYNKQLNKFKNADILIIDDLFKGKINETDISIIFEIVNYRYINHKPLLVNSEFKINDMLEFDNAIGSRIYEMCKGNIMEVAGVENNYRLI